MVAPRGATALVGEKLQALVHRHVPEGAGDVGAVLAVLDRLVTRGTADAARGPRHVRAGA